MRRRTGSAALATAVLAVGAALWAWPEVPSFASVRAAHAPSEALLLDRAGGVLHEQRVDDRVRRLGWVTLAELSPTIVPAILAVEDRRFFAHPGVDVRALAGAALAAARGKPRGASTITMQLAALLDARLRPQRGGRSLAQKLRQAAYALALERSWSKQQILEAYLNAACFRGELVGVPAAARALFDRAPHALDEAEAWLLAALLRSPGAQADAVARRACALAERAGAAPSCTELAALADRALRPGLRMRPLAAHAPHLAQRLLAGERKSVRTTVDLGLQLRAQAALARQLGDLEGRNVRDGAVLIADNESGEVLAWVGSSGKVSRARFVDYVRSRRQAGSTLKPFVYALAFEQRLLTPASRLDDSPLELATGVGSYRPENYDRRFHGLVPARLALGSSLNIPAVRALELVGAQALVPRLRSLGFAGLARADLYGPSLAVGAADVTLLELVSAYRALARGGLAGALRVRADDPTTPDQRVLSAEASFLVADVLADRGSRRLSFGLESALATRFWSAVKTGTSKDMRDNWCIGFSRRYSIGVWVGNDSGDPMWNVSGMDGAAPVWVELMNALHSGVPSVPPTPPPGVVRAGGEWWLRGSEPAPALAAEPRRLARIISPARDLVIALDPDIPPPLQRVLLEAEPRSGSLAWRLDGSALGSASQPRLWSPAPGRHELALEDAGGRTLDAVRFVVR
ncbi:MAG TPA: penicillin-binding protein 1C [Myxococcota bacterium]